MVVVQEILRFDSLPPIQSQLNVTSSLQSHYYYIHHPYLVAVVVVVAVFARALTMMTFVARLVDIVPAYPK